jgi:F-type H+-transporting ATPase subunit delta
LSAVHRMYAQALFEAAKENGRLEQVHSDLQEFARAVEDVPELRAVLRNPQVEPRSKAGVLKEILGDADEHVRNLRMLNADKGRNADIDEIVGEFERLVAREERRLEVELTTPYELSDQEASQILKQIEEASGRKVEATRTVDPDLIGGLVLQAGSLRVDASVRGRLERLRRELVAGR